MSKILITGGCGFLGSNLASHFIRTGNEVVVVDAMFRVGSEANKSWLQHQAEEKQLRFYNSDTANNDALVECIRKESKLDYVCHLAGQVAMTTSIADPRRDFLTNVIGSFNLLEAVRKYSPDALLVYSSTNKVYGDLQNIQLIEKETRFSPQDYPNGFDETLPLDFASPYGCSKGSADQYFRDWFRNFGLKTVVFRHSSIYGGRQFATYDQGWVGWFCQQALNQQQNHQSGQPVVAFTISGTGKQVRDVLHAEDLINLYELALHNKDIVAGNIFNIGGGIKNSLSLVELFYLLESTLALNYPLQYEKLSRRQSDQDFFVADISKASALIGWTPNINAENGINKMISWISQQPTLR
jgi:CDP-paratose 2-epimerase